MGFKLVRITQVEFIGTNIQSPVIPTYNKDCKLFIQGIVPRETHCIITLLFVTINELYYEISALNSNDLCICTLNSYFEFRVEIFRHLT